MNRLVLLGGMLLMVAAAQEKAPASVWDGVYTDGQASRGEADYTKNCSSCHGAKLEGQGQTPALSGSDFLSSWKGMTLGDLFDQIQATMPADRPGQLTKAQNADILAYILKFNRVPAGHDELPADSDALKRIRIEAEKPR